MLNIGETQMSEQEQQWNDQHQLEQQLETIFDYLLDGAPLDNEQIDFQKSITTKNSLKTYLTIWIRLLHVLQLEVTNDYY